MATWSRRLMNVEISTPDTYRVEPTKKSPMDGKSLWNCWQWYIRECTEGEPCRTSFHQMKRPDVDITVIVSWQGVHFRGNSELAVANFELPKADSVSEGAKCM